MDHGFLSGFYTMILATCFASAGNMRHVQLGSETASITGCFRILQKRSVR
jgi:hypothetical protein